MYKTILAGACFATVLTCAIGARAQTVATPHKETPVEKIDVNSPENAGRRQFNDFLNGITAQTAAQRHAAVFALNSRSQAEARQKDAHTKILNLIGGLPDKAPLKAQVTGTTQAVGYHIEKVLFESQPGYPVPALVYVPDTKAASGRFPAIVIAPGHGAQGKASDFVFASTFVKNGFVVLSYDPIGQGERLQYLDPKTGESLATRSTGEHAEAALQPTLFGDAIARYFVGDAISAVDYLVSRPDVDADRIGAFGCSGGGADTALLSALDTRIKATGTACYITSFDMLMPSVGPQDAEQSIPGFLAAGLDLADWIELAAPRPYAIISTTEDMFPYAGAQRTEAEVRSFYRLFQADNNLEFITGAGGHGNLGPIRTKILSFFLKQLQPGSDFAHPVLPELPKTGATDLPDGITSDAFKVTSTGQVATSYPNVETVHSLNLKRVSAYAAQHPISSNRPISALRKEVYAVTKSLTTPLAAGAEPDPSTNAFDENTLTEGTVAIQRGVLHTEPGIDVQFVMATPAGTAKKSAVLLLTNAAANPGNEAEQKKLHDEMLQLTSQGNLVLAVAPRPSPSGSEETKSPILGSFYMAELRAELNGRTLLGMRVDDVIHAIDFLAALDQVNPKKITAKASGHLGLVLLHAAVLDARLTHIHMDHALTSYHSLLEAPLPVGAPEDILPGVIKHYDLPDLVNALGQKLTLTDPLQGTDDLSLVH
jgi:cephalosporin-C deacetylase-like acetyl esterase